MKCCCCGDPAVEEMYCVRKAKPGGRYFCLGFCVRCSMLLSICRAARGIHHFPFHRGAEVKNEMSHSFHEGEEVNKKDQVEIQLSSTKNLAGNWTDWYTIDVCWDDTLTNPHLQTWWLPLSPKKRTKVTFIWPHEYRYAIRWRSLFYHMTSWSMISEQSESCHV